MSNLVYNITYLAWNITIARHVPVTIVHDVPVDLLRQRLEGGDVEGCRVNDVDLGVKTNHIDFLKLDIMT